MSGSAVNRSAIAFVVAAASTGWLVVVALAWVLWQHPEEALLATAAILFGWAMTGDQAPLASMDCRSSQDHVSDRATHPVRADAHRNP